MHPRQCCIYFGTDLLHLLWHNRFLKYHFLKNFGENQYAKKTFSHLSVDDRNTIAQKLNEGTSLNSIAELLGKQRSSVSREIRRHSVKVKPSNFNRAINKCAHRKDCKFTALCAECLDDKLCKTCISCNRVCANFKQEFCSRLLRAPYVCNGCPERKASCNRFTRFFYRPAEAQKKYLEILSSARTGIVLNIPEFYELDEKIRPLVLRGQSISHILNSGKIPLDVSRRTIYRYVGAGYFTFNNMDLVRKVRYKARKPKNRPPTKERAFLNGRRYSDYLTFLTSNPNADIVQMDTVIGRVGGNALLTLHFVNSSFMLAFLLDEHTVAAVRKVFDGLKELLGERYSKLLFIVLTDNGSEFFDPSAIEKIDGEGEYTTMLFYCNPYSSWEKAEIENNHALVRRILPKGMSFDGLTQEHVSLAMSHINSYLRDSLDGESPYNVFTSIYGEETAELLSIAKIPPQDVLMKPKLLKI